MPIVVACEKCLSIFDVDEKLGGQHVICETCSHTIRVPIPASEKPQLKIRAIWQDANQPPPAEPPPISFAEDDEPAPVSPPPLVEESHYDLDISEEVDDEPAPTPSRRIFIPTPAPAEPPPAAPPPPPAPRSSPALSVSFSRSTAYSKMSRRELESAAWVGRWSPLLLFAVFFGGLVQIIIVVIALRVKTGAMPGSDFLGPMAGRWAGGVALACGVVAPLMLLGVWLSSKILSFEILEGAYLKCLTILGVPQIAGIVTMTTILLWTMGLLPKEALVPVVLGAFLLTLVMMLILLKESFMLGWLKATSTTAIMLIVAIGVPVMVVMLVGGSIAQFVRLLQMGRQ